MNSVPDPRLPQYPALQFLTRRRKSIPLAAAVIVFALGLWLSLRTGATDVAVIGVALAVIVRFLARAALELLELVTELLIPR
jgi:hypothetical protein